MLTKNSKNRDLFEAKINFMWHSNPDPERPSVVTWGFIKYMNGTCMHPLCPAFSSVVSGLQGKSLLGFKPPFEVQIFIWIFLDVYFCASFMFNTYGTHSINMYLNGYN